MTNKRDLFFRPQKQADNDGSGDAQRRFTFI